MHGSDRGRAVVIVAATAACALLIAAVGTWLGFWVGYRRCGSGDPSALPSRGSPLEWYCREWILTRLALVTFTLVPIASVVVGGILATTRRRLLPLAWGIAAGAFSVAISTALGFLPR